MVLRTEDLGDVEDVPNGITLHDLVERVKAEGWDLKQVQVLAVSGESPYDEPDLEVTRQWDDGTLPPIPKPFHPAAPTDVQFNPELVDLPELGQTDPVRGSIGPWAPSREQRQMDDATAPKRPSILRRAKQWKDMFR